MGWLATLADSWRDLVTYRHLLYQLTLRDVRIRYKQAVMGFAWAVLLPILIVLSGIVVRYAMSYLSGVELATDVIAGLAIKAIPWAFFVGAIQFSSGVLIANSALVTKIYFPREVLPLASVLAQCFDSAIGGIAVVAVLPLLGVTYGWTALWALPLLLTLFLFTVGTSLLLSSANLFFRDVKYIVRVVLTFGIFFTPVFFEPEMFGGTGAQLMMLNPMAPILEGLRLSVIEGHNLSQMLVVGAPGAEILAWSPNYLVYVFALTILGSAATAVLFHRLEFLFAEYI
jgi:ABC-type polysaccharide/polyol phosphate export permease